MTRTRIVGWLRVILPLTALVILSTLFLLGRKPEPGASLPYADVTPEELAARPQITQPRFAGVAGDGTEIAVEAKSASPGQQDGRSTVDEVRLTLTGTDGVVAHVDAQQGEMMGQQLRLADDVRMDTSTGWVLTSQELLAELDQGTLRSDSRVDVTAPFGELTAGGMTLRRTPDGTGNHVLDLNGGVRMLYRP